MSTTASGLCAGCHNSVRLGSAFCGHCGRPTHRADDGPDVPPPRHGARPTDAAGPGTPGDLAGGTTRFLGAAAHLNSDLAEGLIAEFLVEPRRSVPRSPGVDATSVLGDAAASHRRRQVRDAVLLLLGLLVAVGHLWLFVAWLVVGIGARIFAAQGEGLSEGAGRSKIRTAALIVAVVLGLVVAAGVGLASVVVGGLVSTSYGVGAYGGSYAGGSTVAGVLGIVALLLVPVVLLADEFLVVALIRRHFSRQRFRHEPDPAEAGIVSALRRIGRGRFRRALDRVRAAERRRGLGEAEVVVFRGDNPFVGAGLCWSQRSFVFPLQNEDPDDRRPPQVSPHELHREVVRGVEHLRHTSSLSPHGRLGWVRVEDKVLVSAEELISHWPTAEAQSYLPDGVHAPPVSTASAGLVGQLIAMPREWARHYLCFQVEGWDRDLTVSCYFTLGTDGHLLYLEWVPCVLPPINQVIRVIDDRRALQQQALRRGLVALVAFPASLITRFHRVVKTFTPIRVHDDELFAAKYGAGSSLRELAAGPLTDYFRASDASRYVSLFDRTVLEAVRGFLSARGLKVADIDQAVNQIIHVQATNSTFSVGQKSSATGAPPSSAPAPGGTK